MPKSLLRAFWKKKFESAYIERNWNFGGAHCEFLNISGRIEKHPKLQGANPYFPQKIRKRERKKKKPKPARFRRISANSCWTPARFSPESLLRAFWEKKNWKCLHWEKLKLWGGAHCEFLNISGRIENHSKLQGANPYFPIFLDMFIQKKEEKKFKLVIFILLDVIYSRLSYIEDYFELEC